MIIYCHKCDAETRWDKVKGKKKQEQCAVCKDVFPCRKPCSHLDCADDRSFLERIKYAK